MTPKMTTLLFVYGTLRRGHDNFAARRMHARAEFLSEASIRANIRFRGPYLAIQRGAGRVTGEVFRMESKVLRALNAYEGADYRLRRTIARTTAGLRLPVWAYWEVGD